MIFNVKAFLDSGLTPEQLVVLLAAKMKEYDYLRTHAETRNMFNGGLLTLIKGRPNQDEHEKIRLSENGKKLLDLILSAPLTQDAIDTTEALYEVYIQNGFRDRVGKSKPEVQKLVNWFMLETGREQKEIVEVVNYYCLTTEKKFISMLPNLIWKPKNMFAVNPKLEESKLLSLFEGR